MASVFRALTRPPLLVGVPVAPALLSFFALFMSGLLVSKFIWILIPLVHVLMKRKANKDEQYFSLLYLWLKTRGNAAINRFYNVNTISCQNYDGVDVSEFIESMKLNQRMPLEKRIPYSTHVDDYIIKNRDSSLVATWLVDGEPFESQTHDALEMLTTHLNQSIVGFSGEPVTFYTHRIRYKYTDEFTSRSGNYYADEIAERYYKGIKKKPFFKTVIYVSLCFLPYTKEEKAERKTKGAAFREKTQKDAILRMNELRGTVESMLQHYRPERLGMYEDNGVVCSSQLSFYNYLITGQWQKVRVPRMPYYSLLGNLDIFLSTDTAQFSNQRFFRSLEIKGYSKYTGTGLLDVLQYLPVEYVLTQSFTSMSKNEALAAIKDKGKRLKGSGDDAKEELGDLNVARSMVTSGDISMGYYHYSLIVYADSPEQLIKDANTVQAALTDLGMIVTLSTLSLAAAFLAQLPGVYNLRPRLTMLNSQNFVDLNALHSIQSGKREKLPWGEAITIARTNSHKPYYLNVHNSRLGTDDFNKKTLGNFKIIGAPGSGKTIQLTFMQNMIQKYNNPVSFSAQAKTKRTTTVYFDKDRGAEMNIRALGGEYYRVLAGVETGWNPFRLEANKRNRRFVKQLMKILVTGRGEKLTARQELALFRATDDVMDLPLELRTFGISRLLENLPEDTTVEAQENGLRLRLSQWKKGGDFGWIFDNEEDTFDISNVDNFGIDGTEFLDDPDTCGPITFYLLYRVTSLLDGRRLVIFFDEFWKWLGTEAFADFVYNMLKVIRKLNGVVGMATQSLDEALKNKVAKAIIELTATDFYLANPNADYKDYVEGAKVSPEHFEIIRNIDPESRQLLVVKNPVRKGDVKKFASLISLDLSGLGDYTKVMSGSEDNLEIFDSIYKPGMKPQEWLNKYLSQAL
ncbi:VirB3 family type IV secretion system protein [Salmonella enterica]|nr:VirB3 family type IV secretion system protein [Salmonella enterica]